MAQPPVPVSSFRPQLMVSQPGVGRDGTRLAQRSYIDAQWCRWYQSLPRKMGGYREQLRNLSGLARAIDVFSNDGFTYVHVGTGNGIFRYAIDNDGGLNTGLIDRTPAGYVPNPSFNWQFAQQFDIPTDTTLIFANGTPSASSITTSSEHPVYYGDIVAGTPLQQIYSISFTGSISGTTLTVTDITRGTLDVGTVIEGPGVTPGTTILTVTTPYSAGPPVVPGVYVLGTSQTVASTTLASAPVLASGGIVAVGSYLFTYGHDGIVRWSSPTNPLDFLGPGSGDSRPIGDKIVRGLPLRGQSGPAIILWSLSSVIIGSFVGPPLFWDFTTVTVNASVLSSNGFIEQDGIYYWATTSGWSLFNGVTRELGNYDNKQWFIEGINWKQRQKVFTFKQPRWNELWWCFPLLNESECTHAVIYNMTEKRWYDTVLPNGGRSAGYYEFVFNFPIMAGVEPHPDTGGGYSMWQHEKGVDEVSGQAPVPLAVRSYFETHEFNSVAPAQPGQLGVDQGQSFSVLEPDFIQSGPLEFSVTSRSNARAKLRTLQDPITIVENPATPQEQLVKFKWSGRLNSFRIESNVQGGNYIAGSSLIHWQPGDARRED